MRILELLLVLVPVATTAAAPQQRLLVVSSPRELELRPGASSTLRINAPDAPELRASVGEVDPPRPVASGIYEARYRAPRESHPQVAIITATTAGAYGWVAVPLAGTGELEVKTKPNGEATARVGDRWFGPVRADSSGRAVVPIVVPPGTTHAVVGSKQVRLAAPEPVLPFAVLDKNTVAASTRATVGVRVFVVEPTGVPSKNAPLRVEVSEGVLSAPREVEAGVFEASWDIPRAVPGEAWLATWLAGDSRNPSRVFLPRPSTGTEISQAPPSTAAPSTPPPAPPATKPPASAAGAAGGAAAGAAAGAVATTPPVTAPPPRTAPPPQATVPPATTVPPPATSAPAVSPPVAQAEVPAVPSRVPPREPARPPLDSAPYREPPRDFAIDLRTGAAWDPDGLRALTAGFQLAWFPYPLGGTVGFALDGSGLAVREEGQVVTPELTRDVSTVARIFPIQGLALVRVPLLGGAVVGGLGGGAAYGTVEVASRGQPTADASGWAPAFTGLLGYGHPAGAGSLFLELRGQYVDAIADERIPGALELFGVSVGYRFGL